MKKLLIATMLLASLLTMPIPAMTQVNVNITIGVPPPVIFQEPPDVIVIPDTNYVYAVPDINIDLFFWNGWWWRPWQGRWYRSQYYDRGWVYYRSVPSFYFDVDPGWRGYHRDRNWYGHPWYYERISQRRLQQNWKRWDENRHWEKRQTWGVQNYQPRPQQQKQDLRRERQQQYQQRPEVREYQQQRQQLQRQPQVRQPQREPQVQQPRQQPRENVQRPPKQQGRPDVQQQQRPPQEKDQRPQRSGPQDKPEGREREPRK
jgi:hypothetical protein